eukprot:7246490-Pyramimonas_sp.AAC.1
MLLDPPHILPLTSPSSSPSPPRLCPSGPPRPSRAGRPGAKKGSQKHPPFVHPLFTCQASTEEPVSRASE